MGRLGLTKVLVVGVAGPVSFDCTVGVARLAGCSELFLLLVCLGEWVGVLLGVDFAVVCSFLLLPGSSRMSRTLKPFETNCLLPEVEVVSTSIGLELFDSPLEGDFAGVGGVAGGLELDTGDEDRDRLRDSSLACGLLLDPFFKPEIPAEKGPKRAGLFLKVASSVSLSHLAISS